jgi:hypothetical protein
VRYLPARQFLPNSSRIPESLAYVARRRGQWDRARPISTKPERLGPRDVNLLIQHGDFRMANFVVSQKRYESLIRFSILRRTTWIPRAQGGASHKPRATFRGPRRCSARFIRPPTTPSRWKYAYPAILERRPDKSSLG